jgi:hypothetical protein
VLRKTTLLVLHVRYLAGRWFMVTAPRKSEQTRKKRADEKEASRRDSTNESVFWPACEFQLRPPLLLLE